MVTTTITQYFIGRDAIAESDYQCHDKVSYVDYSDNPEEVSVALGILTYAAIIADNRISDEELLLLYAGLKVTLGDAVDLEECQRIATETLKSKEDIKAAAKELAQTYLSLWRDDDKEYVVNLCIALCAIDGEISGKEINWLKELMRAAGNEA